MFGQVKLTDDGAQRGSDSSALSQIKADILRSVPHLSYRDPSFYYSKRGTFFF